jgi:hypothetical protein
MLSINIEFPVDSNPSTTARAFQTAKFVTAQHSDQPCGTCGDLYSAVSSHLQAVHSPVDGTPGSRQIRSTALADAVAGLQHLLHLAQTGCRPGGDMGKVTLSLLHDVYNTHLQHTDVQRTQRNLRRAAYDLRLLFNHLYDPAPTLLLIGHRKGWGYDLSLNPGSLVQYHLTYHGFTVDSLYASVSLNDLVSSRRNLEYYHRESYKLSVHDLPLIRTLGQFPEIETGLDRSPSWLTPFAVNDGHVSLRLQVLDALGWTAGFNAEHTLTLSVLLPEWEGTTRELLRSAQLL